MAKQRNPAHQALGAYEAACVLGVHYTRPPRLAEAGKLTVHRCKQGEGRGERQVAIFDGAECDRDYVEYDERFQAAGGKTERRPRSCVHLRPRALKKLSAIETPIAFDDAIGAAEAAEILHVHQSFVPRMIKNGEIVGRRLWNGRTSISGRMWIVSRRSCVENVTKMRQIQAAGGKNGRPRKLS